MTKSAFRLFTFPWSIPLLYFCFGSALWAQALDNHLKINAFPVELNQLKTVTLLDRLSWGLYTIRPLTNNASEVSVSTGITSDAHIFPQGANTVYAFVKQFNGDIAKFMNTSLVDSAKVEVGIFSLTQPGNYFMELDKDNAVSLDLYQSVNINPSTSITNFRVISENNESTLIIYFIGDSKPKGIALNTDKERQPQPYKQLSQSIDIEWIGNSHHRINIPTLGESVFIINVSLLQTQVKVQLLRGETPRQRTILK